MNQSREEPPFDMDRLLAVWHEAVLALYLAEDKVEPAKAAFSTLFGAVSGREGESERLLQPSRHWAGGR